MKMKVELGRKVILQDLGLIKEQDNEYWFKMISNRQKFLPL